ncbi:hypothetical protein ACEWY4_019393 [Coilia grayii]|uniref:Ras-GEF domain-containing protein n=1 Tax=Coilia grayii TaxID=363190 RepID=A0ABD1JBC2_9TELE
MGSRTKQRQQQQQPVELCGHAKLTPAVLVEQEEDEEDEEENGTDDSSGSTGSNSSNSSSAEPACVPTFDVPYFRYIDEEDEGKAEDEHEEEDEDEEEEGSSSCSRSLSSLEEDWLGDASSVPCRYGSAWGAVGTPYRVLGYLLTHLRLDHEPSNPASTDSAHMLLLTDSALTASIALESGHMPLLTDSALTASIALESGHMPLLTDSALTASIALEIGHMPLLTDTDLTASIALESGHMPLLTDTDLTASTALESGHINDIRMHCSLTLLAITYSSKRSMVCEDMEEALLRKRKVLHIVSRWSALYTDFLRDNDDITLFTKSLHRCVLDDLYNYPSLEGELRKLRRLLSIQHRKALHKQLGVEESWPQHKPSPPADREVLYCIYVCEDSYISVKAKSSARAEQLLSVLAERLDCPVEDIVLAAVTHSGEKLLLQPQDSVFSDCVLSVGRLQVYRKDLSTVMSPLRDAAQHQQRTAHLLGLNAWDVAVTLTGFDWSLFECLREPELICFTCSRDACVGHTGALERMLQHCNEVQLWVMTELLLCSAHCKRVQLLKKFIKVAAHCKAQRNMSSFFAIILGLNTAAISRLTQTWEDPSFNHKAYRTTFKQMKTPKLPFLPLLLKGDRRRHKDNPDMTCIRHLHLISSQETLFHLSHRLEPRP